MSNKTEETKVETALTEVEETLTLESKRIIITIPKDTIKLDIIPTVLDGDRLVQVKFSMGNNDIQSGFKDYEENYLDPDAVYELTDKGRQVLEEAIKDGYVPETFTEDDDNA